MLSISSSSLCDVVFFFFYYFFFRSFYYFALFIFNQFHVIVVGMILIISARYKHDINLNWFYCARACTLQYSLYDCMHAKIPLSCFVINALDCRLTDARTQAISQRKNMFSIGGIIYFCCCCRCYIY